MSGMMLSMGQIQADIVVVKKLLLEIDSGNRNKHLKSNAAYHIQQAVEKMLKIQVYHSGKPYNNHSMYSHNLNMKKGFGKDKVVRRGKVCMRKKRIGILISFLMPIFVLGGCDEAGIVLGAESQWVVEETDVFSFDLVEATPNQITAIIINHSTETLCWGSYFALEKNVDGVWYELEAQPPEGTVLSWNDMLYTLDGEEEREIGYNLELFGELPEGEYRIVKEFKYETPSKDAWVAACEFMIGE